MMELEEEETAIEEGRNRGRKKGPSAIKEDGTADDGKEVGHGEITVSSPCEVD